MKSEIKFETYPDYYEARDGKTYEDEIIVFTVSAKWANDFIKNKFGMNPKEFMETYIWDQTLLMYDYALSENAILHESLELR